MKRGGQKEEKNLADRSPDKRYLGAYGLFEVCPHSKSNADTATSLGSKPCVRLRRRDHYCSAVSLYFLL